MKNLKSLKEVKKIDGRYTFAHLLAFGDKTEEDECHAVPVGFINGWESYRETNMMKVLCSNYEKGNLVWCDVVFDEENGGYYKVLDSHKLEDGLSYKDLKQLFDITENNLLKLVPCFRDDEEDEESEEDED
jgi:hypothetical protein